MIRVEDLEMICLEAVVSLNVVRLISTIRAYDSFVEHHLCFFFMECAV